MILRVTEYDMICFDQTHSCKVCSVLSKSLSRTVPGLVQHCAGQFEGLKSVLIIDIIMN